MKIGPKFKIARRLGSRVFPKTQTTKFSISGSERGGKTGGKTGGRGGRGRGLSEYGQQLIEKQKARYTYGLKERQFASYVAAARAARSRSVNPVAKLFQLLESRLDNVIFRLGLTPSRAAARQLVTHGHALVNGRRVNVPSCRLRVGDRVAIRPQSRDSGLFKNLTEKLKDYTAPVWLAWQEAEKGGEVKAEPPASEAPADIDFGAILEFYSRV